MLFTRAWCRILTPENAQEVADRLLRLLDGKYFTFTTNSPFGKDTCPNIRLAPEQTRSGKAIEVSHLGPGHVQVRISTTDSVSSFSTYHDNRPGYHNPRVGIAKYTAVIAWVNSDLEPITFTLMLE